MSVDKMLREMIRAEVQSVIAPLASAVNDLQANDDLGAKLRALLGGAAPAKRGPGRSPKVSVLGRKPVASGKKRGRKPGSGAAAKRDCAVIGCKRPVRSKGYCAAHYQKQRMLTKTKRLPADWVDNAQPHSVKDVVLPRGRAGAKALADAKK